MATAYSLKIGSPTGGTAISAFPSSVRYTGEISEASVIYMLFETGWDKYLDEDDITNPIQTNSVVTWTRTSDNGSEVIWRGYIASKRLIEGGPQAEQVFEVVAYDKIGKLRKTIASIDGERIFTQTTPGVAISNRTFKQASAMGDALFPFYPEPGDGDPWIPSASSNTTTLYTDGGGTALTAGATTIIATTSQSGILPMGFIRLDTEWVQYDGYDNTAVGSRYQFKNCTRGALGTTAAEHAETSTIYERLSQKIHPTVAIIAEGYNTDDSAWEPLPSEYYAVQPHEGRLDFTYDILDFPSGSSTYNNVRTSYAVFDEDSGSAVDLGTVTTSVLTETHVNGGPEFTDGVDLTVGTDLDSIKISRVRVDEPVSTITFVQNLIDELGLAKGTDEDALGIWFDHPNNKLIVDAVEQKAAASADFIFSGMTRRDRDITIDDTFSGQLIVYNSGQNENLVSTERAWHPQVGDTIGDNSKEVDFILHIDDTDGEKSLITGWWDNRTTATGHNNYTNRMFDGRPDSGWGLHVGNGSPGDAADVLYLWFDDALDSFTVDTISVLIDCRRFSHTTDPFHIEILGIDANFDKTDPTNIPGANKIAMSGELDLRFKNGVLDQFNEIELSAKDMGIELQGIVIRFNGMATHGSGPVGNTNMRLALIREIKVTGHLNKSVFVSLTNSTTVTNDATTLYAPLTYNKLLQYYSGADHIAPQVDILKIGQSSYNAAVSLGRLALLQKLGYKALRQYELVGYLENYDLPTLGDTATFSDGFTGVVVGIQFTVSRGVETLSLRVLDFTDTLV